MDKRKLAMVYDNRAAWLRLLLAENGNRYSALSERLGLRTPSLRSWCEGKRRVSTTTARRIEAMLSGREPGAVLLLDTDPRDVIPFSEAEIRHQAVFLIEIGKVLGVTIDPEKDRDIVVAQCKRRRHATPDSLRDDIFWVLDSVLDRGRDSAQQADAAAIE